MPRKTEATASGRPRPEEPRLGLGYSTFEYANLGVSAPTLAKDGAVTISVTIKNTSARSGDEVAQLYVERSGPAGTRPIKELKGFACVNLKPGESRTIRLPLKAEALASWASGTHAWKLEPGAVKLSIGSLLGAPIQHHADRAVAATGWP